MRWPSRPSSGPDPVGDFYQGGAFCSMEFDGDLGRIVDWNAGSGKKRKLRWPTDCARA